jgi:outer membrane protein W
MCNTFTRHIWTAAILTSFVCFNPVDILAQTTEGSSSSPDAVTPVAKEKDAEDSSSDEPKKGNFQIGTRSVLRVLTDAESGATGSGYTTSGGFLGTIYAVDEVQNLAPLKPFITYYFAQYVGLELAYDEMKAETVATDVDEPGRIKSDGEASLSGPTLTLLGRYPNESSFTPYLGVGIGFFSGDFEESAEWEGDFSRSRQMEIDDATAFLLTVGTTYNLTPSWLIDFSVQYVQADADATFLGYTKGVLDTNMPGSFPMDNVAFRLGIIYAF